jgi:hypothetical protein
MEIALANKPTISDGNLLESGGVYYIGMANNGKPLRLKTSKALEVQFPKISDKTMGIFYAQKDASGNTNWKPGGAVLKSKKVETILPDTSIVNDQADITIRKDNITYVGRQNVKVYKVTYKFKAHKSTKSAFVGPQAVDTSATVAFPIEQMSSNQSIKSQLCFLKWLENNATFIKKEKPIAYQALEKNAIPSHLAKYNLYVKITGSCDSTNTNAQLGGGVDLRRYAPASLKELGWVNLDCFARDNSKMDQLVNIKTSSGKEEAKMVFAIFQKRKAVMSTYAYGAQGTQFSNIPTGESIKLLSLSANNDRFFIASKEITTHSGKTVELEEKAVSLEEFKKVMEQ